MGRWDHLLGSTTPTSRIDPTAPSEGRWDSLLDDEATTTPKRTLNPAVAAILGPGGAGLAQEIVDMGLVSSFEEQVDPATRRGALGKDIATAVTFPVGGPAIGTGIKGGIMTGALAGARAAAAYEAVRHAVMGKVPGQEALINTAVGAGFSGGLGGIVGTGAAILRKFSAPLYSALGRIADRLEAPPRTMEQIDRELPQIQAQARAAVAKDRGEAARAAYRELVPEGETRESVGEIVHMRAVERARRAASRYGKGPITYESDPDFAADVSRNFFDTITERLPGRSLTTKLVKQARFLRNEYVRKLADGLRTDIQRWGSVGPDLAADMERAEYLTDSAEGERWKWFEDKILSRVKSRADKVNFDKAVRGEAAPANPAIAEAVQYWRIMRSKAFVEAHNHGLRQLAPPTHSAGQTELFPDLAADAAARMSPEKDWVPIPLQERANYAPKIRKPEEIAALQQGGSEERARAIQHLIRTRGVSPTEAGELLDDLVEPHRSGWEFDHSFQFARDDFLDELGVGYETDPSKWGAQWVRNTSGRIARARVFGPQDERIKMYKQLMEREGRPTDTFDTMWRNFIGHRNPTREGRYDTAASVVGTGLTISGLGPRVRLLQYLQLANPIAKFGFRRTLAAIKVAVSDPEMAQFTRTTGALLPSQSMNWIGDPIHDFGSWWVKHIVGMPSADRTVRVISSLSAGMSAVDDAAKFYQLGGTGRRAAMLARNLESLNLPPELIMRQQGKLTTSQIQNAMLAGSHATQFSSHMTTMPLAWRTEAKGRWIYKFRTFAKQQSQFIKDELIGEAKRGNIAPLTRYLSSYAGLYALASPLLDFVSGVERDKEAEAADKVWDYLEGMAYAGALGGFGDAINAARHSTAARVAGYVAGPAVGNVLSTGEALSESVRTGDFSITSPIGLRALRQIPVFGGWAQRWARENL